MIETEHLSPLADLLGVFDGTVFPHRAVGLVRESAAIEQAQRLAVAAGVQWRGVGGGGTDSASWKRSERLRNKLLEASLVDAADVGHRYPVLRPVPSAAESLRRLLELPACSDIRVRAAFCLLSELADSCPVELQRPGGWVCESWLAGVSYDQRSNGADWFELGEIMLPLLAAGVVESKGSTAGHIFYRLTGEQFWTPAEMAVAGKPNREQLRGVYSRAFVATMAQRRTWKATAGAVSVPLSATA